METAQLRSIISLLGYFEASPDSHTENADGTVTVEWRLYGSQKKVTTFSPSGDSWDSKDKEEKAEQILFGKRGIFTTMDTEIPGTYVECEDGLAFQADREFVSTYDEVFSNFEDEERHGYFTIGENLNDSRFTVDAMEILNDSELEIE